MDLLNAEEKEDNSEDYDYLNIIDNEKLCEDIKSMSKYLEDGKDSILCINVRSLNDNFNNLELMIS